MAARGGDDGPALRGARPGAPQQPRDPDQRGPRRLLPAARATGPWCAWPSRAAPGSSARRASTGIEDAGAGVVRAGALRRTRRRGPGAPPGPPARTGLGLRAGLPVDLRAALRHGRRRHLPLPRGRRRRPGHAARGRRHHPHRRAAATSSSRRPTPTNALHRLGIYASTEEHTLADLGPARARRRAGPRLRVAGDGGDRPGPRRRDPLPRGPAARARPGDRRPGARCATCPTCASSTGWCSTRRPRCARCTTG